jgi:nucleoside-diphosphate-sugar epimerase
MGLEGFRILLVGGGGAIGRELSKILTHEGADWFTTYRQGSRPTTSGHLELIPYQKFSQLTAPIDLIINAAGNYSLSWTASDLMKNLDSNIGVSLTIAQFVLEHKVPVITLGTFFEKAPDHFQPWSHYTTSKIAGVNLIREATAIAGTSHSHLYLYDNFGAEIMRGKFIDRLISAAKSQEIILAGDGNQVQDLTAISDVANAIISEARNILILNDCNVMRERQIRSYRVLSLVEISNVFQEITGVKLDIHWNHLKPRRNQVFEVWDSASMLEKWVPQIVLEDYFRSALAKP